MGQSISYLFDSLYLFCYRVVIHMLKPKKAQPFRFFDLPLELRREVYRYADIKLLCADNGVQIPAILKSNIRICREVYQDISLVVVVDTSGAYYPVCKSKRYMARTVRVIGRYWVHCGGGPTRLRVWVESFTMRGRGMAMILELLQRLWVMPGLYAVASGLRENLKDVRRVRVLLSIMEKARRDGDFLVIGDKCRQCFRKTQGKLDEMIDTMTGLGISEWVVKPLALSDAEDAVYIETERRRRIVL